MPYSEDGTIPIIRSGDLGNIDNNDDFLRSSETENIFYLKKGDVLISSIGFGSIGKVQVFDKEGRFGTVSEVTVVRQSKYNPYYLAAFFRSMPGQMQIERYITGATGQLHLYPRDVSKFWVPVLPKYQQNAFEVLAKQSDVKRNNASHLLDAAKRAVEIAIERNESAALNYLESIVVKTAEETEEE
ncbi:MAG: restriction endonuclease subunit S [Chromatiales bacterium]|nr:restriction endonuclease subunit S [Chromatiales bacterium]